MCVSSSVFFCANRRHAERREACHPMLPLKTADNPHWRAAGNGKPYEPPKRRPPLSHGRALQGTLTRLHTFGNLKPGNAKPHICRYFPLRATARKKRPDAAPEVDRLVSVRTKAPARRAVRRPVFVNDARLSEAGNRNTRAFSRVALVFLISEVEASRRGEQSEPRPLHPSPRFSVAPSNSWNRV